MDPAQFLKLLEVFEKVTSRQFTITGATDWPILLVAGGVIVIFVGAMWRDLRETMTSSIRILSETLKEYRAEAQQNLERLRVDNDKDHEALRAEIKEVRDKLND